VVQVAQALAWMSQQDVGVVNISLVGPDNRLLGQAIGRMAGRGHVIVSAVGNDGPHSPPLYPAAYEDVIGVTAVDANGRILPEAVRGLQSRFAAPGTDLVAARPGGAWHEVRGTSFAAPLVARLAALHAPGPRPDATRETIERLSAIATRTTGQHAGLELLAFGAASASTSNPAED
jgi:subtilisin family serine protease